MSDRILVADDSQGIRDLLQMSLESLGYTVVLAEDGESALERIDEAQPDLMIIDVMMPKVNGFQICRRVKSNPETQETPVILLTARVQEEDVFWGHDCGADEYITKPFKTDHLNATVDHLLRRRREEAAARARAKADRSDHGDEDGEIVMMRWDPRAMDVFRKKYGEIRFSETLQALRAAAQKFIAARRQHGAVGVHVPFGLSVVLDGSGPEALVAAQELVETLNSLATTFYDEDDQSRGHIRFRNPKTGRTEQLPLLSFVARIDPVTVV
jgi:DNA-binding response OmpR family regulator